MYSTDSLGIPYYYVATMISRLLDQPDTTKFSVEWVPLMEAVTYSYIMDWGTILSNNISTQILEYRKNSSISSKIFPPFYMSAYIMDVVCFTSDFPTMIWKWTTQGPFPIHVYQTIGNGLTKFLKEENKSLWPSFPIHYGVYALDNYKHERLEVNQILCLNFESYCGLKRDDTNFRTIE